MSTSRLTKPAAFLAAQALLCAVFVAASPSAASAANGYGSSGDIQHCVANMRASGRYGGGGDDDLGVTEYDVAVGRCTSQMFRQRGAR